MRYLALAILVLCVSLSAYAADVVVTEAHTSFDANQVTIKAGDTLTFSNKDDVTHDIQVIDDNGAIADKGLQKPGQDIQVSFPTSGAYKVRCAIYPGMKMTVMAQ